MMKKFSLTLCIFFFIGLNAFGLNKHYIEKRIKNVKVVIEQKKTYYLKLRNQYSKLMAQTTKTKRSIKVLRSKLKKNRADLKRLNGKIRDLRYDINSISKQLRIQKQKLYNELEKYYEYSKIGNYYKKGVWYEYMNGFIASDMQNKIRQYVSKRAYLRNKLVILNSYVDKKHKILSDIKLKENSLNQQIVYLSDLLKESSKKKEAYLNEIKKLNSEQERLKNILKNIIEQEKKRALERKKRKKLLAKKRSTKNRVTSYEIKKQFKGLYGKVLPPVRGKIIDTFGKKYDTLFKVYTRNDGIDIGVKKGTSVKAVYQGRVDFTGNLPGYGGVVIINHLNGYYTVYGGVVYSVKNGQRISARERIGETATNKLHFELRRHSKAIDPLKLLDRRFLK